MSTLRYANRAKNIKNKPKINEDPKDALLRQFQEEIARLQAMVENGPQGGGGGDGGGGGTGGLDLEQLQRMKAETEKAESEKQEMMALLEKERAEREAIDAQLSALKAKLVGGQMMAPGQTTAALLEGPVSPAKVEEGAATMATPAKPVRSRTRARRRACCSWLTVGCTSVPLCHDLCHCVIMTCASASRPPWLTPG